MPTPSPEAPGEHSDKVRRGVTAVLVDVGGRRLKVTIHRSSGNSDLDRAAQLQVQVQKHWHFRPASRNGTPMQAIGIVPIDFKFD